MDTTTQRLARQVVEALGRRGHTLSSCESLTGGGVGAALTAIPGSSAVYRGGLITYASDLKHTLAGVDDDLIRRTGVVNELVAVQMAEGARRRCGSDWAVSTTGVAGPGSIEGQPVGTVWFAVAGAPTGAVAQLARLDGDREAIRNAAVRHALGIVLEVFRSLRE
ncbi:MAG TPA: CinA family protein [Arachnia sp.]|nr:CinA family protein [Arachnia sp.]HMT86476.1 CinA family protein [Arachnia sp.]